mmetsp:Transcript_36451/g.84812  ORF Transcript_36451/g.84812 Transcript_36451/m.84812 type:complete len:323 (-) Transcript_36451:11-979(-)
MLLLVTDVSVDHRVGDVAHLQRLRQGLGFLPRVAEEDALGGGQSLTKVGEHLKLPAFPFYRDVELVDAWQQCGLIFLDNNVHRVAHELLHEQEDLRRERRREQADLHLRPQAPEDGVDLVLEPPRQHHVDLVQDQALKVLQIKAPPSRHVENTTRSAEHQVRSGTEVLHVCPHRSPAGANAAPHPQVLSKHAGRLVRRRRKLARGHEDKHLTGQDADIDASQCSNQARCHLACARLGLANGVSASNNWDGAGEFEAVGVDASQEVVGQVHVVKRVTRWKLLSTYQSGAVLAARHGSVETCRSEGEDRKGLWYGAGHQKPCLS